VSATDSDLITRVLVANDHHAFAELVRRHQSAVRGLLRKLTNGDFAMADDFAQETFLKAFQNMGSFRGASQFSTWLYRIAYNVFRDSNRKIRETVGIDEEMAAQIPAPPEADAGLKQDLDAAMSRLTAPERESILLCYQSGMSHDEASEAMRIPVGTVKTHILRGKEKLRAFLNKT
jgi:RNA polymerase sigma factor (sigma-70 family)